MNLLDLQLEVLDRATLHSLSSRSDETLDVHNALQGDALCVLDHALGYSASILPNNGLHRVETVTEDEEDPLANSA